MSVHAESSALKLEMLPLLDTATRCFEAYRSAIGEAEWSDATNSALVETEILSHYIYLALPAMLAEHRGADEWTIRFTVGYYAHVKSVVLFDRILDNHDLSLLSLALRHHQLAIQTYTQMFSAASPFWHELHRLNGLTEDGLRAERARFIDQPLAYVDDARTAADRCSMAVLPIFAFDGRMPEQRCRELEQAIRHLHVAMQWMDDLADFEKDVASRQVTPLRTAFHDWKERARVSHLDGSIAFQKKLLFASGVWEQFGRHAEREYDAGRSLACANGFAALAHYCEMGARDARARCEVVAEMKARHQATLAAKANA